MIAVDSNILVYAKREEAPFHEAALRLLRALAEGEKPWAIPWPCIYEYLRVVTHPKVFSPPSDLASTLEDLDHLLASPSLTVLTHGAGHRGIMMRTLLAAAATGNLVHDGHIATLLLEHGVDEFLTADRDFHRFAGLRVTVPFA